MLKKLVASKRLVADLLCLVMVVSFLAGCTTAEESNAVAQAEETTEVVEGKIPKYIFMFIGDGMAGVQTNAAQIYRGTNKHNQMALGTLNFQDFEAVGQQTTHDATSFAPDSASTA